MPVPSQPSRAVLPFAPSMKIAVIAHLKYPIVEPFAGGLEMHTNLLVRQLRANGHEVTLFAADGSDHRLNVEPICRRTAIDGVGTEEANDIAFFREHHAYLQLMTMLRGRDFDVVHNNALHYLPVAMADTLPMPMISVLHTPPFCWLESGIRSSRTAKLSFVGVSHAVAAMWSHVVTVDSVIHNGIDLNRFGFAPEASPDPYLIWYGRIVPEKGTHLAIQAARSTPYRLRICGPIADQAYFSAEVAPLLGDRAVYEGHLSHDRLAGLIAGARAALVTPRWNEPYGLVVAEALACGVPIAAFDRGAISEIVTRQTGVLARPDDPDALARAAIEAVALDRTACRMRAESFCDATVMTEAYEALYRQRIDHANRSLNWTSPVPARQQQQANGAWA